MKENLRLALDVITVVLLMIAIGFNIASKKEEKSETIDLGSISQSEGGFYNPYSHVTAEGYLSTGGNGSEYFEDGQTEVVVDKYLKTVDVDKYTGVVYIIYQYGDSITVTPYLNGDGSVYSVYDYYDTNVLQDKLEGE